MRVSYLANIRLPTPKAHGLQIMKTCEALGQAGVQVTLFVASRGSGRDSEDPFEFFGVKKTFTVKRIRLPDFFSFSARRWFAMRTAYFALAAFLSNLRDRESVIYSRDAIVLAFFLTLTPGRKIFYEAHEDSGFKWAKQLKRCTGVVCTTEHVREAYVSLGIPRSKTIVIRNGVDLGAFYGLPPRAELRRRLSLDPEAKIVMYSGSFSLYVWKGLDTFLEAARLVGSKALFVALGGTPQEIAKLRPGHKNIIFIERVSPKEVIEYLCATDVLVLPNKGGSVESECYTSPLKLFEYMASGVPIIASDLPSIREILDHSNAFLLPPDDASALAAEIVSVLGNYEEAEERARKARRAVASYAWPERAGNIMSFITKTCAAS